MFQRAKVQKFESQSQLLFPQLNGRLKMFQRAKVQKFESQSQQKSKI